MTLRLEYRCLDASFFFQSTSEKQGIKKRDQQLNIFAIVKKKKKIKDK